MVGDRGVLARLESAVEAWANDIVVFVIFDSVIMAASQTPLEYQEACGHVVVSVGNDRAARRHGEDLPAEDQVRGQARHILEVDGQTSRSPRQGN